MSDDNKEEKASLICREEEMRTCEEVPVSSLSCTPHIQTNDRLDLAREKARLSAAERRNNETCEQRAARLERSAARQREKRHKFTTEEREAMREEHKVRARKRRAHETPQEREVRRSKDRDRMRERRALLKQVTDLGPEILAKTCLQLLDTNKVAPALACTSLSTEQLSPVSFSDIPFSSPPGPLLSLQSAAVHVPAVVWKDSESAAAVVQSLTDITSATSLQSLTDITSSASLLPVVQSLTNNTVTLSLMPEKAEQIPIMDQQPSVEKSSNLGACAALNTTTLPIVTNRPGPTNQYTSLAPASLVVRVNGTSAAMCSSTPAKTSTTDPLLCSPSTAPTEEIREGMSHPENSSHRNHPSGHPINTSSSPHKNNLPKSASNCELSDSAFLLESIKLNGNTDVKGLGIVNTSLNGIIDGLGIVNTSLYDVTKEYLLGEQRKYVEQLEKQRVRAARKREVETAEEKAARLQKAAARTRARRLSLTPEEKERIREQNRIRARQRRSVMSTGKRGVNTRPKKGEEGSVCTPCIDKLTSEQGGEEALSRDKTEDFAENVADILMKAFDPS